MTEGANWSGKLPGERPIDIMQNQINAEIDSVKAKLRGGSWDPSIAMMMIFSMMTSGGNELVRQSSQVASATQGYISSMSTVQELLSKPSKPDTINYDINIYTGKKEHVDNPSPTQRDTAFSHMLTYLANSVATKYQKDSNGNDLTGPSGQKIENPAYRFFQAQYERAEKSGSAGTSDLGSQIISAVQDLGGTARGTWTSGKPGYNGGEGVRFELNPGSISNMWERAEPDYPDEIGPGETPPPKEPESELLKNVQSAMGTLNQAYTSTSSSTQAVVKQRMTNLQAMQGVLNKFLTLINDFDKALVGGQKPS